MSKTTIIIPAHNEEAYLNKTIENFRSTAEGEIEISVFLNGYDQYVEGADMVLRWPENIGERIAMNMMVSEATGEYLLRIDAHCNIQPKGWDVMMQEALADKPKGIVIAPIVAISKEWKKIGGWYAFCKLLPTMEEKWVSLKQYNKIEKTMAFTGCGFMIRKDFYDSFGGADESLAKMGAIGPEFALRAWMEGDGVYTRTDVLLGHIFGTGGYSPGQVTTTRKELQEKYGHRYQELREIFSDWELDIKNEMSAETRTIVIDTVKEHETKDSNGKIIKKVVEYFKYVYSDDGTGPSEDKIREKFAPLAKKVGEDVYYTDQNGELVKVDAD